MERNIVPTTHKLFRYGIMSISFEPTIPIINLDIQTYKNFYEIIRALNHEELHFILADLINMDTCAHLDNLIHKHYSDGENSQFREELYELSNKDTKAISKGELIGR